ncbi:MFS transporter [Rothia sp. P6271]|uniref:MFS transporter n=1 Tax=unclassified Rothia (in: high G+C Gram-positive bacteria) TaxID=2689056 RepID=UPI003AD74F92
MATRTTPDTPSAPTHHKTPVPRSRVILASLIGTTIEFYDFYIYATAAVAVFPALFFIGVDDTAKLLASMATFGAAFVARPIGSIIFGHFGDRIGRKATLVGALLTMGIATFLIGLLPTYHQIGLWAPAMLTILRFTQGLGLGGEWSGAALLATEYAEEGKRARAAMWPQLGAPFGFILANGFVLFLTTLMSFDSTADSSNMSHTFMMWGWRIPFLASLVMVFIGLYVRFKLEETPVFAQALKKDERVKAPLVEALKTAWLPMIQGTFIMIACYVLFYLMTAWILSYGIGKVEKGGLGISYHNFLMVQLVSIIFFIIFIPVSGWWADIAGRKQQQLITTLLMSLYGLTFSFFISPTTIGTGENANIVLLTAYMSVGMALMGLSFGSMSAYLPELFATHVRYTGSGIAYNAASILGAALTPFVAVYLNSIGGVGYVGMYLSGAALLSVLFIALTGETKNRDLHTIGR